MHFNLFRGLETLPLRIEKQSKNAEKLVSFLKSHNRVSKVIYPTLKTILNLEISTLQEICMEI